MFIFKAYRKQKGYKGITIFIKFDCSDDKHADMISNFIDYGYELKSDSLKNYEYYRTASLSSIITYNITDRNYDTFNSDIFNKHRL